MNIIKSLALAFGSSLLLCASCTSSESPDIPNNSSDIVINLSTPEDAVSRADNGFKLRYVAQVFKGKTPTETSIARQEIVEGESNNQVVFHVDPDADYAITVFADYIPVNSSASSEGKYSDYFYDTNSSPKKVFPKVSASSSSSSISADFFNNDNYDCFFIKQSIHKEDKAVELKLTLKRIAAKVIVRDNSNFTGTYSISLNSIRVPQAYNFDIDATTQGSTLNQRVNLNQNPIVTESDKDLFYFYTLGSIANNSGDICDINFTSQNGSYTKDTKANSIRVRANFKTIVTGKFLDGPTQSDSSTEGSTDKSGDIILNLTTSYDWEQTPLSWNE